MIFPGNMVRILDSASIAVDPNTGENLDKHGDVFAVAQIDPTDGFVRSLKHIEHGAMGYFPSEVELAPSDVSAPQLTVVFDSIVQTAKQPANSAPKFKVGDFVVIMKDEPCSASLSIGDICLVLSMPPPGAHGVAVIKVGDHDRTVWYIGCEDAELVPPF